MKNKGSDCKNEEKKETLLDKYSKKGGLPHFLGIFTQQSFTDHLGQLDFFAAFEGLVKETDKLKIGNLDFAERMLLIQAKTLDVMFNSLACRANNTDWVQHYETLMRLALKAQAQCRATLETLANIKNPPNIAFVKQANIGHNQQVNNGGPLTNSRAEEIKIQQNQLLGEDHGKRLDIGAQATSIKNDQKLATLDKINRT